MKFACSTFSNDKAAHAPAVTLAFLQSNPVPLHNPTPSVGGVHLGAWRIA